MASVSITHRWADGSGTHVKVTVDPSYPDAVNEAKANAVAAMKDMLGDLAEVEPDGEG